MPSTPSCGEEFDVTQPLSGASGTAPTTGETLLEVEDLRVEFRLSRGTINAVNGVTYQLRAGETLAILGESGSGKSVSAQAIMGLIDSPPGFVTGGAIRYRGDDILQMSEEQHRRLRGPKISMVFQDALTALNPVFPVGWQIGEMLRVHRGVKRRAAREHAIDLMERVGIPSARERIGNYPHEFSGGMRQRVMIAMALALEPDVLIADEPTTALDVTVQAQVMELLHDLQQDTGMGLILITHDLGVVSEVADRLAVMYAGRIVETGTTTELFRSPAHPYTEGLMRSIPRLEHKGERLEPIVGAPPSLGSIPEGCAFHPRCPYRTDRCIAEDPPLYDVGTGYPLTETGLSREHRGTACHHFTEVLRGD
jgi:oligopeptide transport system ATP-binding protein